MSNAGILKITAFSPFAKAISRAKVSRLLHFPTMAEWNDRVSLEAALATLFPQLNEPELIRFIINQSRKQDFAPGQTLLQPGQPLTALPLLIDGTVQIVRTDDKGREIFLYFLHPGETCAVTLQCCRPGGQSSVRATAEEGGSFIALPVRFLETLIDEYPSFRNFVIDTYSKRFDGVLEALDAVAFNKLDDRILHYLQELTIARNTRHLQVTHQEIADHLATTREVISRLLKQLEKLGRVQLLRNQIHLLD
jgi:CRP/FNR family transcriptional regulator, anaerobic regulatory protein